MSDTKTTVKSPFRDLAFFTSCVTGILFSVGYLYETSYLEVFKLNNSELFPDISTSIVYGYRYATLNYFTTIVSILGLALLSIIFFTATKSELQRAIKANVFLKNHASQLQQGLTKKVPGTFFYFGLAVLYSLLVLSAIKSGSLHGENLKSSSNTECLTFNENETKHLNGKLIRIRNGLIVFWDKEQKQTSLLQQSQLVRLNYKQCPSQNILKSK